MVSEVLCPCNISSLPYPCWMWGGYWGEKDQLLLHAADFSAAGEAFETAAVLGHGRGRGRGAVGIPAFSGPINLRFLGLLTPLDFEEQGAEAPLILLSRICGMLGPCLTQASRQDERSTVAIIGEMLRTQLLARGGGG